MRLTQIGVAGANDTGLVLDLGNDHRVRVVRPGVLRVRSGSVGLERALAGRVPVVRQEALAVV